MSRLFFRKTRIIDPGESFSSDTHYDILIEDGTILKIGTDLSSEVDGEWELLEGGVLSPGWVDLRVHLTDPGEEYKETLASLAAAAAHGGFTSVVTMPNTHPPMETSGSIQALRSRAESLPVRILPTGALSEGASGNDLAEVYDMHQAGAVAFTDGIHPTQTTGLLLRGLQYLKAFEGLLMEFPMDLSMARSAQVAEGIPATRLGLPGVPALAETLSVDRALQVLDYFPGRLHLGPITTATAIDQIARAKEQHPDHLSSEVSALYLLLSDEDLEGFDPNVKLWPPLRSPADRSALVQAVAAGHVDAISSGHQPQSIEEKKHDFYQAQPGASTLDIAFAAAWTALDGAGVSLARTIELLTSGPRQILGLPPAQIREGATLDLTWFDPDVTWVPERKDFRSRSAFSPVLGRTLKGQVWGTLCKGQWQSAASPV